MKSILQLIFSVIIGFGLSWLIGSMIAWDLNPGDWHWVLRGLGFIFGVIFTIAAISKFAK